MKGNHEFDATDIAPPVCGGDRKRGQHPRQIKTKRSRQYAHNGAGNGHTNGIGRSSPGRKKTAHLKLTRAGASLRTDRNSNGSSIFRNEAGLNKLNTLCEAMEPRSLKYITAACAGEQLNGSPDELVQRVCTDSRKIAQGDLFFALPGENFDGHDFVDQVIRKGAVGVVLQRERAPASPNGYAPCAWAIRRALSAGFLTADCRDRRIKWENDDQRISRVSFAATPADNLERSQLQQRHWRAAYVIEIGKLA
jgi:hypothetical protein